MKKPNPDTLMKDIEETMKKERIKLRKECAAMQKENKRIKDFYYCLEGIKRSCEYLDLVYLKVFGKTDKQLRETYKIGDKDNLHSYFTLEEKKKVRSATEYVGSLINNWIFYDDIKRMLLQQ